MSTAAILMVKDEADVIGYTVRHLLGQVDRVIVADNMSIDGTLRILADLAKDNPVSLVDDTEPGYYQSQKMTGLAMEALAMGFQWVVPCDADEYWYSPDGRRVGDYLDGLAPDVQIVQAEMHNHIATGVDPPASCSRCSGTGSVPVSDDENSPTIRCPSCRGAVEESPFRRIRYRKRQKDALPKVACRTRPDLVIEQGNHSARTNGSALAVTGLSIRHFPWRSPSQYVSKITNGARAYAATDLPGGLGIHWRMFGDPDSADFAERVATHFRKWFWIPDPDADTSVMYDPAPGA